MLGAMRPRMAPFAALPLAALVGGLLLAGACTPAERVRVSERVAQSGPPPVPSPTIQPPQPDQNDPSGPGRVSGAGVEQVNPGPAPAGAAFRDKDFLLQRITPSRPVYPADRDLGPLGVRSALLSEEESAGFEAARRWAQGWTGALGPDGALIHPSFQDWHTLLWEESGAENWRPSEIRLGRPVREPEGGLRVDLMWRRESRRVRAWLYLDREGTDWKVSDLQIDPAEFALSEPEAEPWMPGSYPSLPD